MGPITTVAGGYAYFEEFMNLERGGFAPRYYRLDRMERLLADFGNPHLAYETIHVAGSKGKGSVCAFAGSILAASGRRVGIYASPHVSDYRERVRVLSRCPADDEAGNLPADDLSDALLIEQFERVRHYADKLSENTPEAELPTTFELLTLFAFLVYEAAGCDAAVIEVGLGGRLDATNVVRPSVGIITPIELEHTDYLGNTIGLIAKEKAGIIKDGMKLFVAPQYPDALEAILLAAAEHGVTATCVQPREQIDTVSVGFGGTDVSLRFDEMAIKTHLRLLGRFQAENAVLATNAVRAAVPTLTDVEIERGLRAAWLPGRLEVIPGSPTVIIDGAHTTRSVQVLLDTIEELAIPYEQRVAVFGAVAGKNHRGMVELLAPHFSRMVIARPGTFKKSDTHALLDLCREYHQACELHDEIDDALEAASDGRLVAALRPAAGNGTGLIVVTGSLYLAGDARHALLPGRDPRPVIEGCP